MARSFPQYFHVTSNAVQAVNAISPSHEVVLRGYYLDNTANTATSYYQFFNLPTADVTLGTTTPVMSIPVPAGLGANLDLWQGAIFTALSFAVTTTAAGSTFPASPVDCTLWTAPF